MISSDGAANRPSSAAMQGQARSNPFAYFFLVLPYGISNGFVGVTLPFVLVREGFSVAAAAAVVALGLSANLWRFAGAPLVDLTLTLRRWYLLGLTGCSITLLLLGFMPLRTEAVIALTAIAFLSQIGANFVVTPVGGFIAHTVAEDQKGGAGGWYQAGNLGGTGLGGGAGVWLASHYSLLAAGATLAGVMLPGGLALGFVPDVRPILGETIGRNCVRRSRSRSGRLDAKAGGDSLI
jgi:MFS family permease